MQEKEHSFLKLMNKGYSGFDQQANKKKNPINLLLLKHSYVYVFYVMKYMGNHFQESSAIWALSLLEKLDPHAFLK